MKLVNKTKYSTRELRTIMCAVHASEPRGKLRTWKELVVTIGYARRGNGHYTGHAYLHGFNAHLSVPRDQMGVTMFAALWRHELWHLYGIEHRDYPESILRCRVESVKHVKRLEDFDVILVEAKPKPVVKPSKEEKQAAKVAALLERRKAWATKRKRATTALAKIDRSLAYYAGQGIEGAALPKAAASPKKRRKKRVTKKAPVHEEGLTILRNLLP